MNENQQDFCLFMVLGESHNKSVMVLYDLIIDWLNRMAKQEKQSNASLLGQQDLADVH